MNVIFIDDDEDLNFLQQRMCARSKIIKNFFIATSGQQTLDYLSETQIAPNIIFVDLNMPIMNGFKFIEEYEKEFSAKFPNTLLYVLSSSVRENDKKMALGYPSVKDFLVKPLTEGKVEEIYHQHINS